MTKKTEHPTCPDCGEIVYAVGPLTWNASGRYWFFQGVPDHHFCGDCGWNDDPNAPDAFRYKELPEYGENVL